MNAAGGATILGMNDGLLFVYSDPGPVPMAEFDDWYDNEHGPARLTVPGVSAGYRFRALDDKAPRWLAYYEISAIGRERRLFGLHRSFGG